ncbi:ABC-type multidrug transport system fused ATPase/permease subunit [Bradyrhizobium sp. USDA 4522]
MVPPQQSVTGAAQPTATSPAAEKGTLLGTLVHLWPYIWPGDRADLKTRVIWSVVLLLFAKLATLSVPFTFKWAIDALNGTGSAPVAASNWVVWLIASPVLMTISYGAVRIIMAVLTQWRDGIFARVAMHAVRRLAYITFVHMHELSLRFHLERKTGGLTRVLERGRSGIETIVRSGDPAADPDHRRGRAAGGGAALAVRLALRARGAAHGRRVHVLHLYRDRVAD